ncbi:hypothetical protein K438DRAFT_1827164, partial [Mycena galopus ATCC 62051]
MKHILSVIGLCLAVGLTSAWNIVDSPSAVERSEQTCGDPVDALPFYRVYQASTVTHAYTTNTIIVQNAILEGWTLQGVAAMVFVTQEVSTVPFYRLYNAADTDEFYTLNTTELDMAMQNGYALVAGDPETYIYQTQICGSVPFYRLHSTAGKDDFYTISEAEMDEYIANQGYTYVEISGYVLPPAGTQC